MFKNSDNGGQVFVNYHPNSNAVVIAFRGSVNIQNWLENLSILKSTFEPNECHDCEVHSGFLDMWDSFKSDVMSYTDQLYNQHGHPNIIVTGHSLGGALATLSGYHLRIKYGAKVTLYNFGSPRVGNEAFYNKIKQLYGGSDFRLVNQDDIVPHWPKALTHYGYHHIEREVFYETDNKFKVCDESGEDPNCSDSWIGLSIPDHLYYLGISTLCNNADEEHLAELKKSIDEMNGPFF